jgi:hypothetical protein
LRSAGLGTLGTAPSMSITFIMSRVGLDEVIGLGLDPGISFMLIASLINLGG